MAVAVCVQSLSLRLAANANRFPSLSRSIAVDQRESSSRGDSPPSSRRTFEAHLIRSLYNNSSAWLLQVEHFGKLERYTTLVFDNRGAGLSGAPWGVFSFVHGFVSE